jgi:hypothetical protein
MTPRASTASCPPSPEPALGGTFPPASLGGLT